MPDSHAEMFEEPKGIAAPINPPVKPTERDEVKAEAAEVKPKVPLPVQEEKPEPKKPDAIQALIDKHFPELTAGGVEAHQPFRAFLLELRNLL